MSLLTGIDKVVYGVDVLAEGRRFFTDWGLEELEATNTKVVFETLEGAQVILKAGNDASLPAAVEEGPTVRQVVWSLADDAALDKIGNRLIKAGCAVSEDQGLLVCVDPVGLSLGFQVASRRTLEIQGAATNAYGVTNRVDTPSPVYKRAEPVRLSHVVLHTDIIADHLAFYTEHLGFHVSDSYPGEGVFLRCQVEGGHHDLFLISSPVKPRGLNHVSFMVRDIYEVIGGGIYMNSRGWNTKIGPGRHPISSAWFWYVECPCGALTEYYADEDYLTSAWQPREFERTLENFAEWSVVGGIDHETRTQIIKGE